MSDRAAVANWVWHGSGAGWLRGALAPASALYGAVIARRNRGYDLGNGVQTTTVPALSVGNLTVGGTGKTPVAAWCAAELARLGARPGIVLRGYGNDEPQVHQLLNPGIPVVANADRVLATAQAATLGADVVVLDDAFQHRRASRVADLVLVSADRWHAPRRLLPAGPWREPLASLQRATVAIVTCKAPVPGAEAAVRQAIADAAPGLPQVVVSLVPAGLRLVEPSGGTDRRSGTPQVQPLSALQGVPVLAISGIGDPAAFEAQLAQLGAAVQGRRFPDHHAYAVAEVAQLARTVPASGLALCTLKDAVKLAPHWPHAAPPLWYVSQTIEVRLGLEVLQTTLSRVLDARAQAHAASPPTAG